MLYLIEDGVEKRGGIFIGMDIYTHNKVVQNTMYCQRH